MYRVTSRYMLVLGVMGACLLHFGSISALAQADMTGCKSSAATGLVSGATPHTPPMPMPVLKPAEPMPTAMAKEGTMKGAVEAQAEMQNNCLDTVLTGEQTVMDKKK